MPDTNDPLKKLCSDANIIGETYYGTIYRAVFTLNGEKAEWDICHIGIPFSPRKEAEMMRRFSLDRKDLQSFYGNFEKATVRHINLIKALNATGIPGVLKSIVEYRSVQYYPRVNREGVQIGQDFYLISTPMEPFVGTDIITQQGAYLQDINNLAVRLLQTAKALNEYGFTLGAVDLDSCFYVTDETTKKYLKLGYGFYGTGPGIVPETYPVDVRPFIPETVANGQEKQSLDSDVRMICAYIWTMLDGKHYTEPNVNAWAALKHYFLTPQSLPANMHPKYAPSELSAILAEGMARGADAMRSLQTDIRQLNRLIACGQVPNTYIPFEEPSYLRQPLPELREEPEEAEQDDHRETREAADKGNQRQKKPKPAGLLIAAVSVLLCAAIVVFYFPGMDGLLNLLHPALNKMSGLSNIYVSGGRVVNDKLEAYPDYDLDDEGNIINASDPQSIIFPKAYVSDYVYIDDVRLTIVEKQYSGIWNGSEADRELRDGIIDLRMVGDLFYSHDADAVNSIPESVMQEYGIRDDSLILLNDNSEEPDSFAVVMLIDLSSAPAEEIFRPAELTENPDRDDLEERAYPVQEIQLTSDTLLYKAQGEWRNRIEVSIAPENAVNSRITLTSEDPEHMYFIVTDDEGKESKTKSIRLSRKGKENISFFAVGNMEGKYLIRIESEDGNLDKKVQMTLAPPENFLAESPPPRPTPTPITTLGPEVSPVADVISTPDPTPWQDYSYYGNAAPDSSGWESSTPITAVAPVETVPESVPLPVYTPETVLPLSCSIAQVELAVGESFRLGDCLDGIEGGYLTAVSNPGGIVSIDQSNGFLLTGLSTGSCNVIVTKGTESISVSVYVS